MALRCETCGLDTDPCACDPPAQLQGERIVFREWNVGEDLELLSTYQGEPWSREMTAGCTQLEELKVAWEREEPIEGGHVAPVADCQCGLHAFYDVPERRTYSDEGRSVVGAIAVSGRTLLGPTGVRAEKATIVLLAYGSERQKVLAQAAAAKLGVGCCALEELGDLALEHGQPVPADERPESPGRPPGLPAGGNWIGPGFAIGIAQPTNVSIKNNSFHAAITDPLARVVTSARDMVAQGFKTKRKIRLRDCKRIMIANSHFDLRSPFGSRPLLIDGKGSEDISIIGNIIDGRAKYPPLRAFQLLAGALVLGGALGAGGVALF